MKKTPPAASPDPTPDTYVSALRGWRGDCVETLRAAVHSAALFDFLGEQILKRDKR